VDFERAAINAFSTVFPTAEVTGCYFHLTQSVVRKVAEVGLKTQYEHDNSVREFAWKK
jgi:transposase-like protein